MTYSTTAQVKGKLLAWLEITDVRYDTYIDTLRANYEEEINSELRPYTTVPVPAAFNDYNVLIEVECYLCAGAIEFERADSPSGGEESKGRMLIDRGYELLNKWIKTHFITDPANTIAHYRSSNSWDCTPADTNESTII